MYWIADRKVNKEEYTNFLKTCLRDDLKSIEDMNKQIQAIQLNIGTLKDSIHRTLKVLEDKYNVNLEIDKKNIIPEIYSSIYDLHYIAENLYIDNLFSNKGVSALNHLKDRGLSIDTIKKFF